jgi:valyl-tRNA synthetase
VDPLVINEKYGTDAVRFALLVAAAPGNDIAWSEEVILRGRNFANKIWNASRLLLSREKGEPVRVSLADRWIGSRLNVAIRKANEAFESHRYHEAADALWTFFWDEYCDWYLELKKPDADWAYAFLTYQKALLLLHPLMPFITEELWHRLGRQGSIALESYPQEGTAPDDLDAESEMKLLQDIVIAARELRADYVADRRVELTGKLYCRREVPIDVISRLTSIPLELSLTRLENPSRSTRDFDLLVNKHFKISFEATMAPMSASVVPEALTARLRKENEQLEKVILSTETQLGNNDFVTKAPDRVVESMRTKLAEYEERLAKNKATLGE